MLGMGGAEQPLCPTGAVELEGDSQRLREMHPLHAAPNNTLRKLGADGRQGQRVNVHGTGSVP